MNSISKTMALALAAVICPVNTGLGDAPPSTSKEKATQFLRIEEDDRGQPRALQTAVVRYVPTEGTGGVAVDLIGAIHIGERSYYEKLNDLFKTYDAVLFELVAQKDAAMTPGSARQTDNPIGLLQQIPQTLLGLDSQLERIDYQKKNFVHADLSPREIAATIRKRGDNELTLALSALVDIMRQANKAELQRQRDNRQADNGATDLPDLIDSLGDPVKLKRMLAKQFVQTDSIADALGNTMNQILIRDRNKAALKVLQTQIAQGKKRIAIFYGAAHMPDFEKRLKADFGLKRTEQQWLSAWDLRTRGNGEVDAANSILKLLEQLGQ